MNNPQGEKEFNRTSNELTADAYRGLWLANAAENLKTYRNHRRFREILVDRSKMALVCGAGPSLDLHSDLIQVYRNRLCIIAADMAFPALIERGIVPDYVVNMDPREMLKSCFSHAPAGAKARLIAATITHPALLGAWKGEIFFYNLFDEGTAVLKQIAGKFTGLTNIQSRYHVGELCICIASLHFRFAHIAFTGIDLACIENRYYASGVPFMHMPDLSETIVLMGVDNQPTVTTGRFALYMRAFVENYIAGYGKNSEIYNLSKGIIPLPYRLADFEALLHQTG